MGAKMTSGIRVFFDDRGLDVSQGSSGWLMKTQRNGRPMAYYVSVSGGQFYLELDAVKPEIPVELRGRVRYCTFIDHINARSPTRQLLKLGRYGSRSGKAIAEIMDENVHGVPGGCKVSYCARSVVALILFRSCVLSGTQSKRGFSYEPPTPTPT